ncbi:hypothetical protein AS156_12595 [Bradyrhizobium macuxiense]|uniref:DUF2946 family protein n=1 Tax=Bradyrhizobium macuxiense TaxID=1755647 RepID=A0A109JMA1_9BRAD|nr:hypothetical protein [Bradyrhizobium macuxiense]KWV51414.1 hypothetical protein AS156_12595 [Bradyrhizobium macuxiense]
MDARRFANLWIILLVAAGLLLAPLAVPVMASPMAGAAGMADEAMQAMSDHQAMADDMPCCPDKAKSNPCDSCPFLALCMLSISVPVPAGAASLIARDPLRSQFAAHDDRLLDGLGAKPPDHPPRINV